MFPRHIISLILFYFFPGEGYGYDHRYVVECHLSGFRECISEIARYLAAIEGMDLQDPLRLRIMSHLQCFLTQKELAARANSAGTPSGYHHAYVQAAAPAPPPFPLYHHQQAYQGQSSSAVSVAAATAFHHQHQVHSSHTPVTQADSTTASPHAPSTYSSGAATRSSASDNTSTTNSGSHMVHASMTNANDYTSVVPESSGTHLDHHSHHHLQQQQGTTYLDLTHSGRVVQPYPGVAFATGASDLYTPNLANYNNNSAKPYRPWGAEMAY